eukprot:Hpha_TRINITY_DN15503_c2_g1::TRINITY_DN15503_c2_g1_i1::g.104600::m.104600
MGCGASRPRGGSPASHQLPTTSSPRPFTQLLSEFTSTLPSEDTSDAKQSLRLSLSVERFEITSEPVPLSASASSSTFSTVGPSTGDVTSRSPDCVSLGFSFTDSDRMTTRSCTKNSVDESRDVTDLSAAAAAALVVAVAAQPHDSRETPSSGEPGQGGSFMLPPFVNEQRRASLDTNIDSTDPCLTPPSPPTSPCSPLSPRSPRSPGLVGELSRRVEELLGSQDPRDDGEPLRSVRSLSRRVADGESTPQLVTELLQALQESEEARLRLANDIRSLPLQALQESEARLRRVNSLRTPWQQSSSPDSAKVRGPVVPRLPHRPRVSGARRRTSPSFTKFPKLGTQQEELSALIEGDVPEPAHRPASDEFALTEGPFSGQKREEGKADALRIQ